MVELIDNAIFDNHLFEQQVHEAIVNTYVINQKADLGKVMNYIKEQNFTISAYDLCTMAKNEDLFHWSGLCDSHNNKLLASMLSN
jgi:hypothetical protein